MTAERTVDPRDLEVLRRISAGESTFRPDAGETTDAPQWLRVVERLRRLSQQGYLRMPEPDEFYGVPGYEEVGPCEIMANGYDLLERHGP
jgi:hypothetical protein